MTDSNFLVRGAAFYNLSSNVEFLMEAAGGPGQMAIDMAIIYACMVMNIKTMVIMSELVITEKTDNINSNNDNDNRKTVGKGPRKS